MCSQTRTDGHTSTHAHINTNAHTEADTCTHSRTCLLFCLFAQVQLNMRVLISYSLVIAVLDVMRLIFLVLDTRDGVVVTAKSLENNSKYLSVNSFIKAHKDDFQGVDVLQWLDLRSRHHINGGSGSSSSSSSSTDGGGGFVDVHQLPVFNPGSVMHNGWLNGTS